jgi:hypothetical protein
MRKNLRRRFVLPVRSIETEEGKDYYENLKHYLLEEYRNKIAIHSSILDDVHILINKEARLFDKNHNSKETEDIKNIKFNLAHQKLEKYSLIEGVSIFEKSIASILDFYCGKNGIKDAAKKNDQNNWQGIEDRLDICLKKLKLPKEFEPKYFLMKNFRKLRHQFVHMSDGAFSFKSDSDNFESFLLKLEGISSKSYHCTIDGESGAFIVYNIISGKFVRKFYEESVIFISMLLEIMFPTEKDKVFNFKK